MTFSATEAAFEGFRLVRRKPMTVIFWALTYLVVFGVLFGLGAGALARLMAVQTQLQGTTQPDVQDMAAMGQAILGIAALSVPLGLVLGSVLNAAVARAVVRPAESAFGYLRLGMDEVRVLGVSIIMGIVFGVVSFAVFIVVVLLGSVAGSTGQDALWIVVVLAGLAGFGVIIWLAVRLSLAIPIVVAERRFALFDSFGLTKGHTLPLLGMALLAGVMTILVSLLSTIVVMPLTFMTGGLNSLAAYDGQSTAEILSVAGPMIAGWVVINALFSALQLAVLYAPFSAAYRAFKGQPPAE